jgi:hypothetical protein
MKLEMDLVREILSSLESFDGYTETGALKVEGYSQEQVEYHVFQLWQEGLLRGLDASSGDRRKVLPQGLTWEGHKFLAVARDDTVWRKAKKAIAGMGGAVAISVVKELVIKLADSIS